MANYETEALVIGSKNFGDADKIITLLTAARGKVKCAAYGTRRAKNPLSAPLMMFCNINAELSEGKNLDIIRQANILGRFPKLDTDLNKMAYGLFIAELLGELLPENTAEPEIFEFSLRVFKTLEERNERITANIAAWKLLSLAGFPLLPDVCPICDKKTEKSLKLSVKEGGFICENCRANDEKEISEGEKELLLNFISLDWEKIDAGLNFSVKGDNLLGVEKILILFLHNVLGCHLKSLKFIRDIT